MLKKPIAGIVLFLTTGCLPQLQPDQVIVDGEAALEVQPDVFLLGAALRSRNESRDKALAEIAESLARIQETLPTLEGLTHLSIDAEAAEITSIQDAECLKGAAYSFEEHCPVIGYFGAVTISVKGAPASVSGGTLSLLSELGAERVKLTGYSLNDPAQAKQDAIDAAVKDAHRKAQSIASAAGSAVVGPVRIQYGEGFSDRGYYDAMSFDQAVSPDMVTVASPVSPQAGLNLDPQPIKIEAKVTASFEIE